MELTSDHDPVVLHNDRDSGSTTKTKQAGEKVLDFDYSQQGADWPKKFPECARSQQSPINLLDPISSYGQAYSLIDAELDALTKTYGVA